MSISFLIWLHLNVDQKSGEHQNVGKNGTFMHEHFKTELSQSAHQTRLCSLHFMLFLKIF